MRVATANTPHRLGAGRPGSANPMINHIRNIASQRGVRVIGVQEVTDVEGRTLAPPGWGWHRPTRVQSEALFWDRAIWDVLGRGAVRISSPGFPPRHVLWVRLRNKRSSRVTTFACVHLLAFKDDNHRNAKEFKTQAERVADWLGKGPRRVVVGDFNAGAKSHWLKPITRVAYFHTPDVRSGPKGQSIDLVAATKDMPPPRDAEPLPKGPSDHNPVLVRLIRM